MGSRRRRSSGEWSRLVEEYRDSGLTQVEFARLRGLNVGTFRQRLYARRGTASQGPSAGRFVELRVPDTAASTPVVGCRVRVGEVEVELSSLPSAAWLRSLAGLEAGC